MPEVLPFRALRYNADQVGGLDAVLAPPYDIIQPDDHTELLARAPHNIVGLTLRGPDDPKEWHASAAERYRQWQREGILVRDEAPALYAYSQTFTHPNGRRLTRTAVLGMVALSPFSEREVRPHERTHSGPKLDRLKLMRAAEANLSPIFALYDASRDVGSLLSDLHQRPPLAQATDNHGIVHELRRTVTPAEVATIQSACRRGPVYIADGHHRYETALSYREERAAATPDWDPAAPANYVLMALVAMDDPGLVILPAHRLVRFPGGMNVNALMFELQRHASVASVPMGNVPLTDAVESMTSCEPDCHRFGLYTNDGAWHTVRMDRSYHSASPLDRLEVVALQRSILQPHLGIDKDELDRAERIDYTPDPESAVQRVDSGEFDAVLFVRPPAVHEVQAVADAGEYMPQKGTYFYPKLITGMALADLDAW